MNRDGRFLRNAEEEEAQQTATPSGEASDVLASWLRGAAVGDKKAFTAFYGATGPRVFGLCMRILKNHAQAEEVVQEVYFEAWRIAARFDARKGSPEAWLMTMAHRRAVDRVRAWQASENRDARFAAEAETVDALSAADRALDDLEHRRVRRCMKTLTELQRRAIGLAYYRGLTYRQVAELLQAALPTVKTRIRDGLSKLRDCLGVAR
ncbi:ECF RNA polymerase sigma factor SigK [Salininema proteolyticum]|uniref:ECF RNA polymerase sigma factor SigK n=1 Tax=Salininema proteolyticum TaxID=1607685 RepID=A0ABV8U2Y9_9ACTN